MEEQNQGLIQPGQQSQTEPAKARGGFLTAFLILVMVFNLLGGLAYIYFMVAPDAIQGAVPDMKNWTIVLFTILSFANLAFAIAIWNWKRWGVYGFGVSTLIAFVINIVMGFSILQAALGLIGLAILFALIKPLWQAME